MDSYDIHRDIAGGGKFPKLLMKPKFWIMLIFTLACVALVAFNEIYLADKLMENRDNVRILLASIVGFVLLAGYVKLVADAIEKKIIGKGN